jgi:hypothetical protein
VFPSLLEALMEAIVGRDIEYTATFGLAIAAAVLLKQAHEARPAGRLGRGWLGATKKEE